MTDIVIYFFGNLSKKGAKYTMLKQNVAKTMLLAIFFLIVGSATVFAATYNFKFEPPFLGSAKHSKPAVADGKFTPYVYPTGSTSATTYVLTKKEPLSIEKVSNFRTNVTSGKKTFTYDQGFGGSGQSYKLSGYPSNQNFQGYDAAGTWKP